MNTAAAVRGASPSLALIRAERPYAHGRLIGEQAVADRLGPLAERAA